MQLFLDPLDLRPEFQEGEAGDIDQAISTRDVKFHTLNEQAQAAVRIVGRGIFYSWDRQTYNAVFVGDDR